MPLLYHKILVLFLIATLFCANQALAQSRVPVTEWIIQLPQNKGIFIEDRVGKALFEDWNWQVISIDTSIADSKKKWEELRSLGCMPTPNRSVPLRGNPNDDLFQEQWNMQQIGAPKAWDVCDGGTAANGAPIAVAILDSGCDIAHPDLAANIWVNPFEIPNNGIDDDNNNYTDDINGWNYSTGDGVINDVNNPHGTEVSSIVAARGNNNIGYTGVSQRSKMIILQDANTSIAKVLGAYRYALDLRKLYNKTNGARGALVVATNASWGISDVFCDTEYPLVRAMYDSLSLSGILTACAAPNDNINIDVRGDFPASCSSDGLIAVTATMQNDHRDPTAGYGKRLIDLAAPGKVVPVCRFGTYDFESGTSIATPHVTGAIALLYSFSNKVFSDKIATQPYAIAQLIRRVLLEGVDKIADLNGECVTNGRLNVSKSLDLLREQFSVSAENKILSVYPNPASTQLNIRIAVIENSNDINLRIYNSVGQLVRTDKRRYIIGDDNTLTISVGDLPQGAYLLEVRFGNDAKGIVQKWVKN